jgi:hypothetical protein
MIHNDVQRTSIFLGDEDRAAIRMIQDRFGVSTDSVAVRLALRVLAQAKELSISPLPREVAHHEGEVRNGEAEEDGS